MITNPVRKPRKKAPVAFVVKGNMPLARGRAKLKRVGITTKDEITALFKEGKGGTCTIEELSNLRKWVGFLPTKKKAAAKPKSDNNQTSRKKNGGAGRGQGRKKGAATTRTREIADKLAKSSDISPLEYMLAVLNTTPASLKIQYDSGEIDNPQYMVALADLTRRRDNAAKDAASYIHPRLSSVEANVILSGQDYFAKLLEGMG